MWIRRNAKRNSKKAEQGPGKDAFSAAVRPFPEEAAVPAPGEWRGHGPASLLRAQARAVPFSGRKAELASLLSWMDGSTQGRVMLIAGPAGSGKTRLALEFVQHLRASPQWRERGWRCGIVQPADSDEAIRAIGAMRHPALLVVDDAQSHIATVVAPLVEALSRHRDDPPVRVLLLSRSRGDWWEPGGALRLIASDVPLLAAAGAAISLAGPEPATCQQQTGEQEIFRHALEAFAAGYGSAVPTVGLSQAPGSPSVLLVHTAALVAILQAADGAGDPGTNSEFAPDEQTIDRLIQHEAIWWRASADRLGVPGPGLDDVTIRHAVALTGLLGADDQDQAALLLRRLPAFRDAPLQALERFLPWLRDLYPPYRGDEGFGALEPGIFLERLVTRELGTLDVLDEVLRSLPDGHAVRGLEVLSRACDHDPDGARPLLGHLLAANLPALAWRAVELVRDAASPGFAETIAELFTSLDLGTEMTTGIIARMGTAPPAALTPVFLALQLRLGAEAITRGDIPAVTGTADVIEEYGDRLAGQGRVDLAESCYRAGAALWREAYAADPGGHRTGLARALTNLGASQSNLGREADALLTGTEAVALWREAQAADPGGHRTGLARALTNLGASQSNLGREADALLTGTEAVALWREAQAADPGGHRTGLARALTNLGASQSNLGREADALLTGTEAVTLWREAYAADPGRHRADLARVLTNQGISLVETGREAAALAANTEAVTLWREAYAAGPVRQRADLGRALGSLGTSLAEIGREAEALEAKAEAETLWREAYAADLARHRTGLATALTNLGVSQSNLGREADALTTQQEAVALWREACVAAPIGCRPGLARALGVLASSLTDIGQEDNALEVRTETASLWREAFAVDPDRYRGPLAEALWELARALHGLSRDSEAHSAQSEAVALYRDLAAADPRTHRANLARSLVDLGVILRATGQFEEARAAHRESVEILRTVAPSAPLVHARFAVAAARRDGILHDLRYKAAASVPQ